MLKKTVLLSSLILFSIPNTLFSNGDECAECMNQVALGTCLCISVFCIFAAEHDKSVRVFNKDKKVPAPKIQQMDDSGYNPDLNGYCLKKDKKNK